MSCSGESIGNEGEIDGERRDAKGEIVERIDILEASFDVVPSTTKELSGNLANGVSQVVGSGGFKT